MLCEDCKKNQACVHLTQISNGQKEEKHLCQACAKEYGDFIFPEDVYKRQEYTASPIRYASAPS